MDKMDRIISDELDMCEKRLRKARKDFDNEEQTFWQGYKHCLLNIDKRLAQDENGYE